MRPAPPFSATNPYGLKSVLRSCDLLTAVQICPPLRTGNEEGIMTELALAAPTHPTDPSITVHR